MSAVLRGFWWSPRQVGASSWRVATLAVAVTSFQLGSVVMPYGAMAQTAAPDRAASAAPAQAPTPPIAFTAKGFRVLAHRLDPRGQLNVWTVQHTATGTKTILYSTLDNSVFFTGALWDGATGANVSDPFYAPIMQAEAPVEGVVAAAAVAAAPAAPTASGTPPAIPESIQRLAQLKGVKEGDAPLYRTLFVFFDPRCPYCKQLYDISRDRQELRGRSIVWLPTAILGDRPRASAQIAEIMQSTNPVEALKIAFTGFSSSNVQPSSATLEAIKENEKVFFTAFQANPGAGSAGVPVAFFVDRAGNPQMVPNPINVFSKIMAEMY